jgi:radical SAM superfamily enzyme YgiQ (UPF0313 family)
MSLKVLLFNPRSANSKPRIPNSILQIAASIDGLHEYIFVDGNLETDPQKKILDYFKDQKVDIFGCTVMPGPQLKQAIPISKKIKELYPNIKTIWGGYFPSNQPKSVLNSGYIDYIVNGPGDNTFPQLLNAIETNSSVDAIKNLIYINEGKLVKTAKEELLDLDKLPKLPYEKLNEFYLQLYKIKNCAKK